MIKISSLTQERREGKATLTISEDGEIRQEEIRLSFKKPTESLWRELCALESENAEDKAVLVAQLVKMDLQSPDITNDDGTVHPLTRKEFEAMELTQLGELWVGVKESFFLRRPASKPETDTKSISSPESEATA